MQQPQPAVSGVLLSYNCEDYISAALQSALGQDCPPMQLVISDDASTDGTVEIIRDGLASYQGPHRVEFHQQQDNSGSKSAHLNRILHRATGNIIVSFDGDDISEPYRVRRIADAFAEHPDAYAVYSSFSLIDGSGRPLGAGNVPHPGREENAARWFTRVDAYAAGTTLAVRRDLVGIFGPLDPAINEDIILPFRASLLGSVIFIDEELVRARRHGASLTADFGRFESLPRYRERFEQGITRAIRQRASRFTDIQTAAALMPDRAADFSALESVVNESVVLAECSAGLVSPSLARRLKALLKLWRAGAYPDERHRQLFLALAPGLYIRYKQGRQQHG